jgi:hypothetical protein
VFQKEVCSGVRNVAVLRKRLYLKAYKLSIDEGANKEHLE